MRFYFFSLKAGVSKLQDLKPKGHDNQYISKNIVYVNNAHGFSYYAAEKDSDVISEQTSIIGIGLTILCLARKKLRKLLSKILKTPKQGI
jgi:hypothetical protein